MDATETRGGVVRTKRRGRFFWAAAAAVILVAGGSPAVRQYVSALWDLGDMADPSGLRKPDSQSKFASMARLHARFPAMAYDLERVRAGVASVPRILLATIPQDMASMADIAERKAVFLRMMLPLILDANERVLRQRAQLLLFQAKRGAGRPLGAGQTARLKSIAVEYSADADRLDDLLAKVDAVPPSLALAQSAIESGWGTSRFILEGNAPFGQWTTRIYDGLAPLKRDAGKTHKVRRFKRLIDSVHSYMRNLNTHSAYSAFRARRADIRGAGKRLDGIVLADALGTYSEEKDRYVDLLREVIRSNTLQPLDGAYFGDAQPSPGA